jgi:hypothetical protein
MYSQKLKRENGFAHIAAIVFIILLLIIGAIGLKVHSEVQQSSRPASSTNDKLDAKNKELAAPTTAKPSTTAAPTPPVPLPPPTPKAVSPPKAKAIPKPPAPPPAPAFTTTIQIKGDASCQSSTLAALKLLSEKAPAHYATATTYISIIECASQGSGVYAYENPPRYLVGDATRSAGTVWYAGTIAHDAGHSKLYHDYLSAHPNQAVPDDIWTGQNAEVSCLNAQYDALGKIGGTQYQLDYVANVINTQYYNVPYSQRWW